MPVWALTRPMPGVIPLKYPDFGWFFQGLGCVSCQVVRSAKGGCQTDTTRAGRRCVPACMATRASAILGAVLAAGVAQAGPAKGSDLTGIYDSNWGEVRLEQRGSRVTGTF